MSLCCMLRHIRVCAQRHWIWAALLTPMNADVTSTLILFVVALLLHCAMYSCSSRTFKLVNALSICSPLSTSQGFLNSTLMQARRSAAVNAPEECAAANQGSRRAKDSLL